MKSSEKPVEVSSSDNLFIIFSASTFRKTSFLILTEDNSSIKEESYESVSAKKLINFVIEF